MSGGQLIFATSLVVPVVAGFAIGRWRFLLFVLGIWVGIAIFLKENNGWHGAGWGDGGILLNVIWALLTFGLAALGVGLRKVPGAGVSTPRRSRPGFGPSYGISAEEDGMLEWGWADSRLSAARNYWIASTSPGGHPSVSPVWGVWVDGAVYFGTNTQSRKARNLDRDPRVVIHLESGDDVVILHGEIEKFVLTEPIADAYNAKYEYRPNPEETSAEGWYRLRPRRALAWLERDYPKTATRFDFD